MQSENQKNFEVKSESKKIDANLIDTLGISIMTDPDLHPLPITPNDPLPIVSIFKSY